MPKRKKMDENIVINYIYDNNKPDGIKNERTAGIRVDFMELKKTLRWDNRVTELIKFTLKKNKMSFCCKV